MGAGSRCAGPGDDASGDVVGAPRLRRLLHAHGGRATAAEDVEDRGWPLAREMAEQNSMIRRGRRVCAYGVPTTLRRCLYAKNGNPTRIRVVYVDIFDTRVHRVFSPGGKTHTGGAAPVPNLMSPGPPKESCASSRASSRSPHQHARVATPTGSDSELDLEARATARRAMNSAQKPSRARAQEARGAHLAQDRAEQLKGRGGSASSDAARSTRPLKPNGARGTRAATNAPCSSFLRAEARARRGSRG